MRTSAFANAPSSDWEQVFISNIPTIDRIVRSLARRQHMSADEFQECRSMIRLKLLENDYAVLRKFQGRSTMATYLAVVISRLVLDHRNKMWGRWRPSAAARRRGQVAELLERLTSRDGLTFDEACAVVETNHGFDGGRDALDDLRTRAALTRRKRMVSEPLTEIEVAAEPAVDPVEAAQRRERTARVAAALASALRRLSPENRRLVAMRFHGGLSVADIARELALDQKALYRRLGRVLAELRRHLQEHRVDSADANDAIGAPDWELTGTELERAAVCECPL
jgi:RNA polymerase sigma factor for flagellar operon FliA